MSTETIERSPLDKLDEKFHKKMGGARPGAGQPPGGLRRRTQEIAARCVEEGKAPLEVMLENMRFAHEAANELLQKIEKHLAGEGGEELIDLRSEFKALMDLKDRAQVYARHAAPYIHPRLSAIEISGGLGVAVDAPPKAYATPAQAMAAYQEMVKNTTDFIIPETPQLLAIENDAPKDQPIIEADFIDEKSG